MSHVHFPEFPISEGICLRIAAVLLALPTFAVAQWQPLPSPVSSDLLTVDARDQAFWAAGKDNTVVHSADNGQSWQTCAKPATDRHTTFSAIAAVDGSTAVVISSGKGNQSRVYRTDDGCKSWQIAFENPEDAGSFVTLRRVTGKQIYLLGEPVAGKFQMYLSQDGGAKWFVTDDAGLDAQPGESALGTTLTAAGPFLYFGSRSTAGPRLHFTEAKCKPGQSDVCDVVWASSPFPASSGLLQAIGVRTALSMSGKAFTYVLGAAPDANPVTAASTANNGAAWSASQVPPSVQPVRLAFIVSRQAWIAVGAGGTAITDIDAKRWHSAQAAGSEQDRGWTALALPFAVGAGGHIARLDEAKVQ